MAARVGLWIDHRKAIVVSLTGGEPELEVVESGIERKPQPAGGSPSKTPYGTQDAVAENALERKYKKQLGLYYDDVITSVHDAESLYIFGPGEAKIEFEKHITKKAPDCHISAVETADKMTPNQIKSKVKAFYQQ